MQPVASRRRPCGTGTGPGCACACGSVDQLERFAGETRALRSCSDRRLPSTVATEMNKPVACRGPLPIPIHPIFSGSQKPPPLEPSLDCSSFETIQTGLTLGHLFKMSGCWSGIHWVWGQAQPKQWLGLCGSRMHFGPTRLRFYCGLWISWILKERGSPSLLVCIIFIHSFVHSTHRISQSKGCWKR